jgi:adenylate cyclase
MDRSGTTAVIPLLKEAELEAERTAGWVRIVLAAVLAASLLVSGRIAAIAGYEDVWARLGLGALAVAAFLALGIASLVLVQTGAYAPWTAFALTAGDAVIVVLAVAVTLRDTELRGNWIAIAPALWAAPLLLAVGALRYRPGVQLWATGIMIGGLGIVAVAFHRSIFLPPADAAAFAANPLAADLLSLPANLVRAVMLALAGATTALVMLRARRLLHRAVTEGSERASIARFLPAEIAPLMEGDSLAVWRQGRRQEITVVFVDLRGSTALAEHMDPARLSVFISSFRRRVMQAAQTHGGVVDKFMGDGALLIFGVPQPEPDDARRAILCAREIIRLVARWNAKRRFDPPVRVGIGLHTGEAFCGVLGAQERLEFTVLGDVVNVAARIEQMTKRFGTSLVASEATVVRAGESNGWQEVGREAPRGRSGAVRMLAPSDLVLASLHEPKSGAEGGGAHG